MTFKGFDTPKTTNQPIRFWVDNNRHKKVMLWLSAKLGNAVCLENEHSKS